VRVREVIAANQTKHVDRSYYQPRSIWEPYTVTEVTKLVINGNVNVNVLTTESTDAVKVANPITTATRTARTRTATALSRTCLLSSQFSE
jgi:hypothetical protein